MQSSKQRRPSVLEKLMGFLDEPPRQQPAKKHRRVLSDSYLQRVASIGVSDKPFPREHHSFKMSIKGQRDVLVRDALKIKKKGKTELISSQGKPTSLEQGRISENGDVELHMKIRDGKVEKNQDMFFFSSSAYEGFQNREVSFETNVVRKAQKETGSRECGKDLFVRNLIKSSFDSASPPTSWVFLRPVGVNWALRKYKLMNQNSYKNTGLKPNKSLRLNRKPCHDSGSNQILKETSCIVMDDPKSESDDKEDGSSSPYTDTIIQQEDSMLSRCSRMQRYFLTSCEDFSQLSPDSVLEPPFRDSASSSSERLKNSKIDITGLRMQLELLTRESPEEPEMIVSSDEEDSEEEGSLEEDSKANQNHMMKPFRVKESRNFSYLIDVLSEANFHGRQLSPEFPITPIVFEMLEKKYGEQMCWKRSERKLLFDRMNMGLMEITKPFMGVPSWSMSVSERLRFEPRQEMIEEELWGWLERQEKQVGKEGLLKMEINGWFDFEDEIIAICSELERLLIDELVSDFVRIESL